MVNVNKERKMSGKIRKKEKKGRKNRSFTKLDVILIGILYFLTIFNEELRNGS